MHNYEFKLTPAYCLYNGIAIKKQQGSKICFLAENPEDIQVRERVTKAFRHYLEYVNQQEDCPEEFKTKPSVQFIAGNHKELKMQVSHLYEQESFSAPTDDAPIEKEEDSAAVLLFDSIMEAARKQKATDIHIENNCVRLRILGKLEFFTKLSEDKCTELVQRIKFLAGMNVLEKRRSQDGHFTYGETDPVFVRVSTVGVVSSKITQSGESVVIRLLDTNRLPLALDKLGFNIPQLSKIKELSRNPNGLLIICGPTGAGKSTTAAALITHIRQEHDDSVKIVSLEDPPEYLISGVTQIQIDEKVDNSFSQALMHVFRQDPDVLMIGEIRDETSATVAVRAALTGHLVIATLHTDSAAGVVFRLADLGIPKNLIVSVLKGVISQELNNFQGYVNLVADVAVPMQKLETTVNLDISENEMEKLFDHTTNYAQVLNKTLGILKQKHQKPVIHYAKNYSKKAVG